MKISPALLLAAFLNFTMLAVADGPKPPAAAMTRTITEVTPDEAALLMKGNPGPALVLDVRTPDEFAEGHIPGAKNVDFLGDDFDKQIAALPADRPLIVHCAAGNRSSKAVLKISTLLKPMRIFHLKSGFNGWKAAGKPVETKSAAK